MQTVELSSQQVIDLQGYCYELSFDLHKRSLVVCIITELSKTIDIEYEDVTHANTEHIQPAHSLEAETGEVRENEGG